MTLVNIKQYHYLFLNRLAIEYFWLLLYTGEHMQDNTLRQGRPPAAGMRRLTHEEGTEHDRIARLPEFCG